MELYSESENLSNMDRMTEADFHFFGNYILPSLMIIFTALILFGLE
jgi:hypothetical protein